MEYMVGCEGPGSEILSTSSSATGVEVAGCCFAAGEIEGYMLVRLLGDSDVSIVGADVPTSCPSHGVGNIVGRRLA